MNSPGSEHPGQFLAVSDCRRPPLPLCQEIHVVELRAPFTSALDPLGHVDDHSTRMLHTPPSRRAEAFHDPDPSAALRKLSASSSDPVVMSRLHCMAAVDAEISEGILTRDGWCLNAAREIVRRTVARLRRK